ncbi:BTB/POZ domain-containing protein At5g17580-like [Mercurialis annua]|uniref:BTB/POZ domain-containing protein At5g17580-like n=1 Tax=Mercurialis annua TaxID=3986 RepID=UPI00215F24B0|nr:BTB/POZ domain-containing protein At5g17580-like [Mercurialis annua]
MELFRYSNHRHYQKIGKTAVSSWLPKTTYQPDEQFLAHNVPSSLKILAARSAKVSAMLKENPNVKYSSLLQHIPTDTDILELVERFCHGYELNFSSENVISLICIANYLEMTDCYSNNNLLEMVLRFFDEKILSSWDETIKSLRFAGRSLKEAMRLGLFNACVESLVEKALVKPHLLGDPMLNSTSEEDSGDEEQEEEDYKRNSRRRLFDLGGNLEDLTVLPLQLYQPIIRTMIQRKVPKEYTAVSLYKYAEKWVVSNSEGGQNISILKRNSPRDVIEAVESLLPNENGLIPCPLLFILLKFAISCESSNECRNGLEIRIGKQLEQATVRDLVMLSQGYNTKEAKYETECLKRIVKHFYENYNSRTTSGLNSVAELIEEFLVEVSSDIDLKIDTFIAIIEISTAATSATHKTADRIYRGIDIYLDKHKYLTEAEREEVCSMLDCHKMSSEACEHAVSNGRLPLRFVVQILFVSQLKMRCLIANQVHEKIKDEEDENDVKLEGGDDEEEEVMNQMGKMSLKLSDLERKCSAMRKEVCCSNQELKKEKTSMWKQMKRKLGCTNSIQDCNSQLKRKKKKKKVYSKH